jgi:hypothetical protein
MTEDQQTIERLRQDVITVRADAERLLSLCVERLALCDDVKAQLEGMTARCVQMEADAAIALKATLARQ